MGIVVKENYGDKMVSYASVKIGVDRVFNHYGKINALLIAFIAVKQGFPVWIFGVIILMIPLVMFFDLKYLYPMELEYVFRKNNVFMELCDKVESIKKDGQKIN